MEVSFFFFFFFFFWFVITRVSRKLTTLKQSQCDDCNVQRHLSIKKNAKMASNIASTSTRRSLDVVWPLDGGLSQLFVYQFVSELQLLV